MNLTSPDHQSSHSPIYFPAAWISPDFSLAMYGSEESVCGVMNYAAGFGAARRESSP